MILGEQSNIELYATGGTLDMVWSPEEDELMSISDSNCVKYLAFLARLGYPGIDTEVLMQKDSRKIDDSDQLKIVNTVAEAAAQRVVVTTGTYAMDAIGKDIEEHPNMETNTTGMSVAMVSSIIPIKGFEMSDAPFNLGMAVAVLGHVDPKEVPVFGVASGIAAPIGTMRKSLHDATYRRRGSEINILGYEDYTLVPAGGTIDFESDGLDGVAPAKRSLIPGYIRDNVRSSVKFQATPPILKDSRLLTEGDMDTIVDLVRSAQSEFVIVTSGLLRIGELRGKLNDALSAGDDHDRSRRVVLTGSRHMLGTVGYSDATFNLGFAHGILGKVDPGAHVALTGRLIKDHENPLEYAYRPDELEKVKLQY